MNQEITNFRKELSVTLNGGNAHMSFEDAVAYFPMQHINSKIPETPYSPWHFLEHLRIAQWDILQFIINPGHISPEWPQGYRPGADELANKEKWEWTINSFKKYLKRLQEIALDSSIDLFAPIPHAPKYTIFKELLTASSHNSYHIGEFAIIRQIIDTWPKDRPYLTG